MVAQLHSCRFRSIQFRCCKHSNQAWTAAQLRSCFLMQFRYHKNSHTKGQSVAQLHNCCSRRMNCRYPKNSNPRLNSRTVAVAAWRLDVYSCTFCSQRGVSICCVTWAVFESLSVALTAAGLLRVARWVGAELPMARDCVSWFHTCHP